MRRAWQETINLLRATPDSAAERKANLWWMSFQLNGMAQHTRNHFDQMRKAIEAARVSVPA